MFAVTLTALLLPLALSAPTPRDVTTITDGSAVSTQTYDYVIAGGGLAGVVLAARLSEDASKKILVIEAGKDESRNPDVTDASAYQRAFGTEIDWAYQTVPQGSADGRSQTMRSGKALGGSTALNGMAWSKPHSFQLDALESVGNTGVNWTSLQPYMLKAENFHAPSSSQGVAYRSECRGTGGGVDTSIDGTPNSFERDYTSALQSLGLPFIDDNTCGDPAGLAPMSHNSFNNIRADAYRAYLLGTTKPNLTILTGANVGRVLLSPDARPRATGVEFRDAKGQTFTVNASGEVLMAAGSIKTPLILQNSGIGPATFLSSAGVEQRVDLPVGQNLIDQATITTNFDIKAAGGGGQPVTWPRFEDLFKDDDAARMRNLLETKLSAYAQEAVDAGAAASAQGLQTILEIQRDWILNQKVAVSENYDYSYDKTLGYDSWFLLPFGRGSIKITSNDAYSPNFSIDPRFFANEFDALASAATARFTRTASSTVPLANSVTGERDTASVGNTLEEWAEWTKANYRSNWHPIGTVAMMSQELGGCVDDRHRVYGVDGLRVVDGSNLPFQVSSHLMSVLYGLSERAAELIAADAGNSTTPNPKPTGEIHPKKDAAKCLQVDGAYGDGAAVTVATCNGSDQQKWEFTNGATAIKAKGQNFCLDAGQYPGDGTRMKIWTCYDNLAAQAWYTVDGIIRLSGINQCLDLTDGSTVDGTRIQTWMCDASNENQQWTM